MSKSKILNFLTTISISGYALPGIILAVAYITFVAWFDNTIISYFEIQSVKKIFIGSILGLIITSAFFSGSETALTAVSKARIRHLADEGDSRAKEVEKLISKQDTLISTLLVGSNLVNILASVLATSLFISLFGEIGVVLALSLIHI